MCLHRASNLKKLTKHHRRSAKSPQIKEEKCETLIVDGEKKQPHDDSRDELKREEGKKKKKPSLLAGRVDRADANRV